MLSFSDVSNVQNVTVLCFLICATQKPDVKTSQNFSSCVHVVVSCVHVVMAWSFANNTVVHHILPVLLMNSCFHLTA